MDESVFFESEALQAGDRPPVPVPQKRGTGDPERALPSGQTCEVPTHEALPHLHCSAVSGLPNDPGPPLDGRGRSLLALPLSSPFAGRAR